MRARALTAALALCAPGLTAEAQPRRQVARAPGPQVQAAPEPPSASSVEVAAPSVPVTSTREAAESRIARMFRLAVAEASSGTCEGSRIAQRACATLLAYAEDYCRVTGGEVTASGGVAQDGAIFSGAEPTPVPPGVMTARRFCAQVAEGGAPTTASVCPPTDDGGGDLLGVVQVATGVLSVASARERYLAGAQACADSAEAPAGDVGRGDPAGTAIPTPSNEGARWWRPTRVAVMFGGALPVAEVSRARVTPGVWTGRLGVGFRWGVVDVEVEGTALGLEGAVDYFGGQRTMTVAGGGVGLRAAHTFQWARVGLRLGGGAGWLHTRREVDVNAFVHEVEGDSLDAHAFAALEVVLWRRLSGGSLRAALEARADYVTLGWADNHFIENLFAGAQGGVSYAF